MLTSLSEDTTEGDCPGLFGAISRLWSVVPNRWSTMGWSVKPSEHQNDLRGFCRTDGDMPDFVPCCNVAVVSIHSSHFVYENCRVEVQELILCYLVIQDIDDPFKDLWRVFVSNNLQFARAAREMRDISLVQGERESSLLTYQLCCLAAADIYASVCNVRCSRRAILLIGSRRAESSACWLLFEVNQSMNQSVHLKRAS